MLKRLLGLICTWITKYCKPGYNCILCHLVPSCVCGRRLFCGVRSIGHLTSLSVKETDLLIFNAPKSLQQKLTKDSCLNYLWINVTKSRKFCYLWLSSLIDSLVFCPFCDACTYHLHTHALTSFSSPIYNTVGLVWFPATISCWIQIHKQMYAY